MSPLEAAEHEARHVLVAVAVGATVTSVEAQESGGMTHVMGLNRRNVIVIAAAGRVGHPGERSDGSRSDDVQAHLAAAQLVAGLERVADARRPVPRPRTTEATFAAIDTAEVYAVPEIIAKRMPRARRLVELAEARAAEILAANRVAVEHFASVLAARGSLNEEEVLALLDEALDVQDKKEAS